MPRPKVSEERRRRIAKACLFCQSSKQKCDGLSPCAQCVKRDQSSTCAYSSHIRSYGHRRRRRRPNAIESQETFPEQIGLRQLHLDRSQPDNATDDEQIASSPVAVPKLPHNLHDASGRTMYVGDCAALSFLQHIQELIEGEQELAAVAADVGNFPVYEEEAPVADDGIILSSSQTDFRDLEELVDVFFASTCGIIDIFCREYVMDLLNCWMSGNLHPNSAGSALLHLVLAYGAQARSATVMDIHRAKSFFNHGRQVALLELTNDPSLETVQAFIIICVYMLGASRRNGAFLNLGIAISAAKSLGFHRDETNEEFPEKERRLRNRIWRTLRYHDLFFCAMMGRTSSILTTDSTVVDDPMVSSYSNPDSLQEMGLQESIHAFSFMERTVNEVYTKRNVPLGLLQRISHDLQQASSNMPLELRTISTRSFPMSSTHSSQQLIIRNASVACSYYFTMLLLTRPFLITRLRAKFRQGRTTASSPGENIGIVDAQVSMDIIKGAVASVDAAMKTIQLLHELMVANMLFNNMPLVVAWAFVSALTVCSAYFGRLELLKECEGAIQQADDVLLYFTKYSPQARRYHLILKKLSRAALDYVKGLEQREKVSQKALMPELFRLNSTHLPYVHQPTMPSVVDNVSLLELAHSFHNVNYAPGDTRSSITGPYMDDIALGIEDIDSIWDIRWEGSLL